MPTNTYTPLATVTLASPAATITFSNIPGTYRDLILESNWKLDSSATAADSFFRINADTGNNYFYSFLAGTGSGSGISATGTQTYLGTNIDDTSVYTRNQVQIFDYAQTDKHKTGLMSEGVTSYAVWRRTFRWNSTSAITSISLTAADRLGSGTPDNFAIGSVFSIYGVIA
jgi:hypothetical protein